MYEVIVVGGGPAGTTAALRARELGARVTLVEKGNMGGTCTNDGCVPIRVLAKAARLVRDAEQFAEYGLEGELPRVDFARLLNRTQRVVYEVQEKKQLRARLEEAGVRVYEGAGEARFLDDRTLVLGEDGATLRGERFVLCAGGHAGRPSIPGGHRALTHSDVWTMKRLPPSVAIVGAAATGCQLASVFAAFGSRVHLLDVAPRILPAEDEAVSKGIAGAFERRGIEVVTGIGGVDRIEGADRGVRLFYRREEGESSLDVGAVILAVGWPANLEGLNLEAAGVEAHRGHVVVDDALCTSAPHVFAAGDITGRMMLVQSATHEGGIAAENAVLGGSRTLKHAVVPHGGFTDPEYGSVGPSEVETRKDDCTVAVVPYADLDRGVIDGHTEGACKLIVSRPTGRILGAHIVGEQAVEVVQIVATAMRAGMRVEQLADLELAYPTFTAVVGLAARRIVRELVPAPSRRGGDELARAAEWEYRRA